MKSPTQLQFLVEFRKMWTLATVITASMIFVFGCFTTFLPLIFKQASVLNKPLRLSQEVDGMWNFLWVIAVYFSIGIVGSDVKSGWFRSLIARPITRQRFLTIKLLAALASVWCTFVVTQILPLALYIPLAKAHLEYRGLDLLYGFLLLVGSSVTYLAICAWLSCWLPGFTNAAVFTVWYIACYFINDAINGSAWDRRWVNIVVKYIYPDGFSYAISSIALHARIASDVVWGMASMAGFLALAFWQITKIQVDKGTE